MDIEVENMRHSIKGLHSTSTVCQKLVLPDVSGFELRCLGTRWIRLVSSGVCSGQSPTNTIVHVVHGCAENSDTVPPLIRQYK